MENKTPQRENGHIDINNENAEQFAKFHFSGNEWQILWVVLRKTWGWQKKEDNISLTQFQKYTNLSRPSVKEAIDKLVGKKVLVVKKNIYINSYSFNKLYNQWIVPKSLLVGKSVITSREIGKKLVGKKVHTNTTIQKTLYKRNIQKKHTSLTDIDFSTIEEIANKYKVPTAFVQSKLDDMTNWLKAKGKTYKDYKHALMNWVKSDAIKILQKQRQNVNKYSVTKV